MLAQILRVIVSVAAFKWLQKNFSLWFLPSLVLILTWLLHGEYLDYLTNLAAAGNQSNSAWLAESYVIKWFITTLVFARLYWVLRPSKKSGGSLGNKASNQDVTAANFQSNKPAAQADGFDFLRHKDQLETRADKIIKGANQEDIDGL